MPKLGCNPTVYAFESLFFPFQKSWYSYFSEVIVVVLGILIALAPDNRNEDRKMEQTQLKALREIDEGLSGLHAYISELRNDIAKEIHRLE